MSSAPNPLVPKEVEKALQAFVLDVLGLDADANGYKTVRIAWQPEGQPAWGLGEDVIVVRAIEQDDEFNRVRDARYTPSNQLVPAPGNVFEVAAQVAEHIGTVTMNQLVMATGTPQAGGTLQNGGHIAISVPDLEIAVDGVVTDAIWQRITLAGGTHYYQMQGNFTVIGDTGSFLLVTKNIGTGLWDQSAAIDSFALHLDTAGIDISAPAGIVSTPDIMVPGNLANETLVYNRRWRGVFVAYGPNSFDNIRKIKSALAKPGADSLLEDVNLFFIADASSPLRVPELFQGQWWERVDFEADFYEGVAETTQVGTVGSAEVIISKENSLSTDILIPTKS